MPVCLIKSFPDAILRKKCAPVALFDGALAKIVKDLILTMKAQPHGIGIAAPQIGIAQQIAIVDVSPRDPAARQWILINPKVLETQEEKMSREGCMSLPDYMGNVKRFSKIKLRWQNLKGEVQEREFQGIEAICVQHEVDHLDGVLFMDRVTSLKRDMIPRVKSSKAS